MKRQWDGRDCWFMLLLTLVWFSVIDVNRCHSNKKNRTSTHAIPLLNASTEALNTVYQVETNEFCGFLRKKLENNTRLQKTSRTWSPVTARLSDNDVMSSEGIRGRDVHATQKITAKKKNFQGRKVGAAVNINF